VGARAVLDECGKFSPPLGFDHRPVYPVAIATPTVLSWLTKSVGTRVKCVAELIGTFCGVRQMS
jgi:hypothetical protein